MNKYFFSLIILFSVLSCNKNSENKNQVETSAKSKIENSDNQSINSVEGRFSSSKIFSTQQMDLELNKKNDTLYVTNFFAVWCKPCMEEIPHFKEKITEMKGQPIKFTFVNLDDKKEWEEVFQNEIKELDIQKNTIFLDGELLDEAFFVKNFSEWRGEFIPFTFFRKGDKKLEVSGSVSKSELDKNIAEF